MRFQHSLVIGVVCFAVTLPLSAVEPPKLPLRFRVEAGKHARIDTPVAVRVEGLAAIKSPVRMVEIAGGKEVAIPHQIEPGPVDGLHWVLAGSTSAGSTRHFELRSGAPARTKPVAVGRKNGQIEVGRGEARVLAYHAAHLDPPAGIDAKYGRSAFIHPLWTPSGQVVTDVFPPDHPHQDGLFFAFVKTEFEDRKPDFWNLLGGTGRVRHAASKVESAGPIFGGFSAEHEHVDLGVAGGKVALRETWQVRVWNPAGPGAKASIIDITTAIRCATEKPLRLPSYHYGGMAVRGARPWVGEQCQFRTSEGKARLEGNHTRARWCDLSGRSGETWAGITLMTHPDNFRFPEPIRIHPTMPYMVFTPSFLGDWTIEPGKPVTLRYRWYVHDGQLDASEAHRVWQDFAAPPLARLEP